MKPRSYSSALHYFLIFLMVASGSVLHLNTNRLPVHAEVNRSQLPNLLPSEPPLFEKSDQRDVEDILLIAQKKASQEKLRFHDVASDYWAAQYINGLAELDLISGYPNGNFQPNGPMTRVEFAALLSKAFSLPQFREFQGFSDISSNYWGYEVIKETNISGFLSGYSDGEFKPNQNISRFEVMVSLVSGLGYSAEGVPNETVSFYQDAYKIPAWMIAKIAAATEKELIVNYPNVRELNFEQEATRAEVAVMVYQALTSVDRATSISSDFVPTLAFLSAVAVSSEENCSTSDIQSYVKELSEYKQSHLQFGTGSLK